MAQARWCLQTGQSVEAYRTLTRTEREVFWDEAQALAKRSK